MKTKVISLAFICTMLMSCLSHEFPNQNGATKQQINENVKNVFGTTFDPNHDWCTTTSGLVTISDIPNGTDKLQLLAYIEENDTTSSLLILNEVSNPSEKETLAYDIPNNNKGMYAAFITSTNFILRKLTNGNSSFATIATARRITRGVSVTMPPITPTIGVIEDSYANERGWIPGEKLYQLSDYSNVGIQTENYDNEDLVSFRALIFSYFKNGRDYNNLPIVLNSGFYNENAYPVTTGTEPIVVSPVYKADKAKQYGNEVWNSDFYYYYFKDSDIEGKTKEEQVAFFQSLPKYKAIEFKQHFGETEDDVLEKRTSYALMYFGDGVPEIGTEGSFTFPEGYKIGFMVRAKTTYENKKKQGELYGDGRLNNQINCYGNFSNGGKSKLGEDGPRVAWLIINGRMMMCWESGTDRDLNDIIIEVEGGIRPLTIIPELDNNYYTFCFEDRELGDYDMNDVVIKGRRIDNTHVEYSIVACGAQDKLEVSNIGDLSGIEIHTLFGVDGFINTTSGSYIEPKTTILIVDKNFSFLDPLTQPIVRDKTTNKLIGLSLVGEDPHGIMIPYNFKYPLERVCIKDAYGRFNSWGENSVTSNDWYKFPIEGKTY